MPRFARGLVVGKFSPLHRGHEHVIRTALERCREVVVISYSSPEFPGCEAVHRERWLRTLFPQVRSVVIDQERLDGLCGPDLPISMPPNDAPDDEQRDFVALLCRDVLRIEIDAVFTSDAYGDGFAARMTRHLRRGDHPPIRHVLVDGLRSAVPISGTTIRQDVHSHRQWLAPSVYASFVRRVCLLGGESTGKSALAEALADGLGTRHAAEYGRELWEQKGGKLEFSDMLRIAETQIRREEQAAGFSNRVLICDSSPLTTLFYSHVTFGRADPALETLAGRPYDLHVLCSPDFPFVQDGTRVDDAFRWRGHRWYLEQFDRRGISFVPATGSLAARVAALTSLLGGAAR